MDQSKSLRSFYEVSRIVKSNILSKNFNYEFEYPDYKKSLLELTKELIKK